MDDAGPADGGAADAATCAKAPCPQSKIEHLVVIVMENKTFDVELGRYCTAPSGSIPTCVDGPACCEAGPATDPSGASPTKLDDTANGSYDPIHLRACEVGEIHGGAMDRFVTGDTGCSDPRNFAYLDPTIAKPLWDLVATGAVADRYFQPVIGASAGNDQYLARAQWVFDDNIAALGAVGAKCETASAAGQVFTGTTIADLLAARGLGLTFYAEGYADAVAASPNCPASPGACPLGFNVYPCVWGPSDDPFELYDSTRDKAPFVADLAQLATDLSGGTLPAVSFVKAIGYKSDHPGSGSRTSDAIAFVTGTVGQVLGSPYAADTLVLVTYDEGGGYFDHVRPPPNGSDGQPYGTRVPLYAFGPFARRGGVSHATMEHSSIVKFIEWNWLGGATGQLEGRDANVNNLGSLLEASATGTAVPAN